MDNNIDLSVAINLIDRKIASLNLKILENKTPELQNELEKYLKIKKEIYEGNMLLVRKIINGEEM